MKRELSAWLVVLAVALAAIACDPIVDPQGASTIDDPTRYCYTFNEEPWSCYLEADRPAGYVPVWVGPQSEVNSASID